MTFRDRLKCSIMAWLRAWDIWLCSGWQGTLYLFNACDKPSGRQMISSYIGKAALNGHRWARRAEAVIDWTFERLGDRPGHCLRAYLHYRGLDG